MYKHLVNLNELVTWSHFRAIFGWGRASLPCRVPCPHCKHGATVFPDYQNTGFWYYCFRCRRAGDLIELAAATWSVSTSVAIARLRSHRVLPHVKGVGRYAELLELREAMAQFLNTVSDPDFLYRHQALEQLLRLAGRGTSSKRIPRNNRSLFSQFVRCASINDIRGLFNIQKRLRSHRYFKQYRLAEQDDFPAMMLVLQSMPGLIEGVITTQLNRGEARPLKWTYQTNRNCFVDLLKEAGVAGPDILWSRQPEAVFGIGSVADFLYAHSEHLRVESHQLPLGLWWMVGNCVTSHTWRQMRSKIVIVGDQSNMAQSLCQAVFADSRLFVSRQPLSSLLTAKGVRPEDFFNNTAKPASRHWTEWLDRYCQRASDEQVEGIIGYLESQRINMGELLSRCPAQLRNRFVAKQTDTVTVSVKQSESLLEKDSRLYWQHRTKPPRLIADFTLRLDRLVRYEDPNFAPRYLGRVLYNKLEIPFCAPVRTIELRPLLFCRRLLIEKGVADCFTDESKQKHVLNLIRLLQPPKIVTGPHRVGWDSRSAMFRFPSFDLPLGGGWISTEDMVNTEFPGHLMLPPDHPNGRQEIEALVRDRNNNRLAWPLLFHLFHNCMADILGLRPLSLLYSRDRVRVNTILQVQSHLSLTIGKDVCKVMEAKHALPAVLGTEKFKDALYRNLTPLLSVGMEIPDDPRVSHQSAGILTHSGSVWSCCVSNHSKVLAERYQHICWPASRILRADPFDSPIGLQLVIPMLLEFVLSRKLKDFRESTEPVLPQMMTVLRLWLENLNLPSNFVLDACRELRFPESESGVSQRLKVVG